MLGRRRRPTAIVAAGILALGGGALAGEAAASARSASAAPVPARAASCVYARIGGARKCLRPGEYCARRDERQYRRHGFTCHRFDAWGDWHLERV